MTDRQDMILITDDDALWSFRAFGVEVRRVYDRESFLLAWQEALNGACSLLFMTESLAAAYADQMGGVVGDEPYPIITLLPGSRGSTGVAADIMRRAVIRALGSDISASQDKEQGIV